MECHPSVWGVLVFLSLALIVSLILNISHYMKKNLLCDFKISFHSHSSYDDHYTEDDPVYGNLSQEVEPDHQMCYASLDHSVKGKRRKPRRKKDPSVEDEERSSKPTIITSKVSIYLNSDQLAAENTVNVEAIHDDPIRLMGLIHTSDGEDI
uniref:T cell receptor associated transmembrane adaptor 1 n=1 Tax=Anas platyrhynchos platyrhynchos TaxID=8840 RepID=U3J2B6_ANAPP